MNKYLVMFSDKFFYRRRTSAGVVVGTIYPSVGLPMEYLVAFEIAQKLQTAGYKDAIVTTLRGTPVKPSDLTQSAEQSIAQIEVEKNVEAVWEAASSK